MLNKIFCNHKYVYLDKVHIINFPGSDWYRFRFMCKKCKKTKYLSSKQIEEKYQQYKSKLSEMVAIDGFVDSSDTKITFPIRRGYHSENYSMYGYAADKTIDYFRSHHHINLEDIPCSISNN